MSKREYWVDYVKVLACILVVLGHFFQSMVKASILPDNNLYQWFNTTIYYFHVPLFFICSGYLYQRYSKVDSWKLWRKNVLKKLITLGVPYLVFSTLTWMLKTVFSNSVNDEISSLGYILFIHPISPYWYLYVLFFLFLLTPTEKSKVGALTLTGIALIAKLLICFRKVALPLQIYVIQGLLANEIWFVLGMILSMVSLEKFKKRWIGILLSMLFLAVSIPAIRNKNEFLAFGLGLLGCTAVLMIMISLEQMKALDWLGRYTMPIFLMHTIFAATLRVVLLKIGVGSTVVHVFAGIAISFIGPIIAIEIMKKIKLDFLVYPGKLMKKRK